MHLLSYNLLKNKAVGELPGLIRKHRPDVLCLQEVDVHLLPNELEGMKLMIGTERNRLGLAIYLDEERYEAERTGSFALRSSHYDRLATPAHERLLGVTVSARETGERFTVGSFHASPLTALNAIRRDQIHAGLDNLKMLGNGAPLMMLGDFNYPMFRRRLAQELNTSGFDLFTPDKETYRSQLTTGYFDFAAGKNFSFEWLHTLKQGLSDHLPILLKAELAA